MRPRAAVNTVTLDIDEDDDLLPLRRGADANDSSSADISDSSDDEEAEQDYDRRAAPSNRVLSQYHGLVPEHARRTGMCMATLLCPVDDGLVGRGDCLSPSLSRSLVLSVCPSVCPCSYTACIMDMALSGFVVVACCPH